MIESLCCGNFLSKTTRKRETTTTIPQNLFSDFGGFPTSNSDILFYSEVLPVLTRISISYFAWNLFLVRKPLGLERPIKRSYLWLFLLLLNRQIHFSLSSPTALLAGHSIVLPCPVTAPPQKSCISSLNALLCI